MSARAPAYRVEGHPPRNPMEAIMFKPVQALYAPLLGLFITAAVVAASQAQVGPGWVLSHQKVSNTEGGFPSGSFLFS